VLQKFISKKKYNIKSIKCYTNHRMVIFKTDFQQLGQTEGQMFMLSVLLK